MSNPLPQTVERIAAFQPDHTPYAQFSIDEMSATHEWFYSNSVLPGPLQLPDVARAILKACRPSDPAEVTETYVAARQQRAAHMAERAFTCEYFIDERVLDASLPGTDWQAQLSHLVETDGRPEAVLRVIPGGTFYIAQDMTALLMRSDATQAVCLETSFDTVQYTDDPKTVAKAVAMFRRLDAIALPQQDSIDAVLSRITD